MRLIDADKVEDKINECVWDAYGSNEDEMAIAYSTARGIIEDAPTVDAVQVVRCKDCAWYKIAELTIDGRPDKRYKPSFCMMWRQYLSENNYCSYGDGDKEKYEADKRG